MITSSNFFEMILFLFSFFSFVPILYFFSLEISRYSAISKIINIYQYTFERKNRIYAAIFVQNRYIDTGFSLKFQCELSKKEIAQDISKTQFLRGLSKKEISWDISEVNFLKKRYPGIFLKPEGLV